MPANGLDKSGRELDAANAVIADVADQQEPAGRLDGDAMRLTQLREGCGPAVAGKSRSARSGKGGDGALFASTLRITWLSRSAM